MNYRLLGKRQSNSQSGLIDHYSLAEIAALIPFFFLNDSSSLVADRPLTLLPSLWAALGGWMVWDTSLISLVCLVLPQHEGILSSLIIKSIKATSMLTRFDVVGFGYQVGGVHVTVGMPIVTWSAVGRCARFWHSQLNHVGDNTINSSAVELYAPCLLGFVKCCILGSMADYPRGRQS